MVPLSIAAERKLFVAIYTRAKKELLPKLWITPKWVCTIHLIINTLFNLFLPKDKRDSYLNNYSTTLGYTIAMASAYSQPYTQWETLCHEIVHALQAKKWTRFLMAFLYTWPLSQGALLLLTCWLPIFWASNGVLMYWIGCWAIIALLHFIPQLPDPWRHRWEIEAYSVSMYLYYMLRDCIPLVYTEHIAKNLHSMNYYITSNNRHNTHWQLDSIATRIIRGTSDIQNNPVVKIAVEEYNKLITNKQ